MTNVSSIDFVAGPEHANQSIIIQIQDDETPEDIEAFVIEILRVELIGHPVVNENGSSYPAIQSNFSKVVVTIIENDNASGVFSLQPEVLTASESRLPQMLSVVRTQGLFGHVQIFFNVSDISATVGADFSVLTANPVVFAPNQTISFISIMIVSDSVPELTEVLKLSLNSAGGGLAFSPPVISSGESTVVIPENDDPFGVFAFASLPDTAKVNEGTDITFTVLRLAGTFGPAVLSWSIPLGLPSSLTREVSMYWSILLSMSHPLITGNLSRTS
jgi:hypothetical protein